MASPDWLRGKLLMIQLCPGSSAIQRPSPCQQRRPFCAHQYPLAGDHTGGMKDGHAAGSRFMLHPEHAKRLLRAGTMKMVNATTPPAPAGVAAITFITLSTSGATATPSTWST